MRKREKRLQSSLDQERVTLRTLIDNLPDGIFLKDRESRFIFANQLIADLMGAPDPSALQGKTDHDFYPKEVADTFLADERAVMESRQPLINKDESESISGKLRWLTTKVALVDSQGEVSGLLGISRVITERHEAEEMLRKSEQRYRDLLEQAADGIFLLDENFNFLVANPEFCRMSGFTAEELLGLNILDTYPEELRDMARARNARIKSGEKLDFERVIKRKDGSVFPVEISARRLVDGRQQGIAHDITNRKRTEKALSRERMFLTALMDNIPDYIYFKDRESRFILNNKAHAQELGAGNPSEMPGKTDFDYFGPEHAQKAFADEQHIIQSGQPLVNITEKETWPGQPDTWVSTTKMPLRNEQGEIIGTFGVSRDITDHREMEMKNLRLATLVNASDDAIVGTDLDNRITVWNTGAERIYGYAAEEVMGATLSSLIPPEREEETKAIRERVMRGEKVSSFETVRLRKDGSRITVSMTLSAIHDQEGKVVGLASTARDVTAQKALQVQVIRSQRLESLATLAAGIAHQFNNINAAVIWTLSPRTRHSQLPSNPT